MVGEVGEHDALHGYNHSLEQELRLLNPHLHNVTGSELAVCGVAMPVFAAVSVLSNLFVFAVLVRKNGGSGGRTALSMLLQCLAQYDTGVAVLAAWNFVVPVWCRHFGGAFADHYMARVHPLVVPYLGPALHMFITGSDCLNLAAAMERYIALDRHFARTKSPHSGFSNRRAFAYIVAVLVFTVAFNLPAIFERTTVEGDDGILEVVSTPLRFNEVYVKMYKLMAEFLIFKATPWMAFLILFLRYNCASS